MSFSKNINWSPKAYQNAAVLARKVGEEMLARLAWMTINPAIVVDVGCGVGELTASLRAHYANATVLAVDLSETMLTAAQQQAPTNHWVCADAGVLPLRDQSVDLICANLIMPWQADIQLLLREWRRVLKPDGVLMFSAFGPDTLKAWRAVWSPAELPAFIDMHDIGDLILQEKLADPVLDVDYYTLTYREQSCLRAELCATGMLSAESAAKSIESVQPDADGTWSLIYEIVYGHAFAPPHSDEVSASEDGIARIPLSNLRRQLRGMG